MRHITKYFLVLIALATALSGCDVEKIIDENFKEKSLVVLAPDFLKNRVTLVLKDEETGLPLDKEFEVKIYSNKKIIDLSGNYKNTFTIKNGILNFALDPNEVVSESSPLNLSLYGEDKTLNFTPFYNSKRISTQGDQVLLSYTRKNNIGSVSSKDSGLFNKGDIFVGSDIFLEVNNERVFVQPITIVDGLQMTLFDGENIYENQNGYRNSIGGWIQLKTNEDPIEKDFVFKGAIDSGRTDLFVNFLSTEINVIFENEGSLFNRGFPEYLYSVTVPKNSIIKQITFLASYTNNYNFRNCEEGFNFKFSGFSDNQEVFLEYGITVSRTADSSRKLSIVGIEPLSLNKDNFNTGINNFYSLNSNKVVFAEHPQYIIEPQEMDLGGAEACGQTYNFKVYPRDGHNRYQLNLQFQCSGEDFSTAPSVVAFLKEESSSIESSLIQFSNGSANLVLKPTAKYLVEGVFNETPFGFTFTANEDNVAEAISSTIANNDNILDIEYTISKLNNIESVINAKVIFKEGQCPE